MTRRPDYEVNKCPVCGAAAGDPCITISGNLASEPHVPRWAEPGTYRERRVFEPYRKYRKAGRP
jgi:hypothetical protein